MPERCRRRFRGTQYEVRVPGGRFHTWANNHLHRARTVAGVRSAINDIRKRLRERRSRASAARALKAAAARHWHVPRRSSGGPLRPKAGARVIVSVARRNSGRGQSVHDKKLSLALCRGPMRKACRADDVLLVVTAAPSDRIRPQAYRDAVEGLNGERALVVACRADKMHPAATYYAKVGLGRPDCWYRKARKGDKHTHVDAKGNAFAVRSRFRAAGAKDDHSFGSNDLHKVVVSTHYLRSATTLEAAPRVPPSLSGLFDKWTGHGCKVLPSGPAGAVKRWLGGL
ncbi:unnamed protein product [Prorocentrum cordatum]|uniref:Uncharacterized protein n=1 Tax=Prorocentrum cordatum TaxID=2364126 RepID=A0ABN9XII8_9DINO|nr:unnamed protein product [Polarella glacialis]